MGTLYVVGGPTTEPDDLTIRARRILSSVALVVAGEVTAARLFLVACGIPTPVAPAADRQLVLSALAGSEVALLLSGRSPVPGAKEQDLVEAALAGGFAVVPVPGPVAALTALVVSGLPADSFVYLGSLPPEPRLRRSLLESMAGEAKTLVLLAEPGELPDLLAALGSAWGDRALALWPASVGAAAEAWRGRLGEAPQAGGLLDASRDWVLVVGGAAEGRDEPWDEDRLRDEIRACRERGLGVGQISRQLAGPSGWARREVYRLALQEDVPERRP